MTERRAGAEFRVAGRTLSGRVMTYGDISPEHRERFLSERSGRRRAHRSTSSTIGT